ncbi:MAG: hypothetical protein M1823_001291 [Watsoniomyces obsoletus]|nr:MAG: hypothetical protein M1823_001291 [Watsoniomyces obsoletus]
MLIFYASKALAILLVTIVSAAPSGPNADDPTRRLNGESGQGYTQQIRLLHQDAVDDLSPEEVSNDQNQQLRGEGLRASQQRVQDVQKEPVPEMSRDVAFALQRRSDDPLANAGPEQVQNLDQGTVRASTLSDAQLMFDRISGEDYELWVKRANYLKKQHEERYNGGKPWSLTDAQRRFRRIKGETFENWRKRAEVLKNELDQKQSGGQPLSEQLIRALKMNQRSAGVGGKMPGGNGKNGKSSDNQQRSEGGTSLLGGLDPDTRERILRKLPSPSKVLGSDQRRSQESKEQAQRRALRRVAYEKFIAEGKIPTGEDIFGPWEKQEGESVAQWKTRREERVRFETRVNELVHQELHQKRGGTTKVGTGAIPTEDMLKHYGEPHRKYTERVQDTRQEWSNRGWDFCIESFGLLYPELDLNTRKDRCRHYVTNLYSVEPTAEWTAGYEDRQKAKEQEQVAKGNVNGQNPLLFSALKGIQDGVKYVKQINPFRWVTPMQRGVPTVPRPLGT